MKVCIVTTAFPRWQGDDRGTFILNAARALAKKGINVRVVAIHSPGAKTHEVMDGIEVVRPPYLPEKLEVLQKEGGGLPIVWRKYPLARVAILPFAIVQTIAVSFYSRDCDIIHANWTLSGAIAWGSQWLHHRPYLVTVQGSDLYQTKDMGWVKFFTRQVFKHASKIIALSNDLVRIVNSFGVDQEKRCIIPNGIDVEAFHPGDEVRENLLLFVGSLIPRKGPIHLLRALPAVLERYPDVRLVMVGEGMLETELNHAAVSLKIGDKVQFLGSRPQEEVSELMRRAKIFILPSLEEGLGVVLLEAIASGTPCIGSRVGGIPDVVVPPVGILVTPEHSEELSEAIISILSNPEKWREMSSAARQRAEDIFSWDKVADQLIGVYNEVLRKQAVRR